MNSKEISWKVKHINLGAYIFEMLWPHRGPYESEDDTCQHAKCLLSVDKNLYEFEISRQFVFLSLYVPIMLQ